MTFTSEGDPGSCPSHFGPQDTSVAPHGLCPCLKRASPGHRPLSHRLGASWTGGDLITTAQEGAPGVHRSVSLPWELAGPVGRGPGLAATAEGPPSPERRVCLHRPAIRPPALGCDGPPFLHRLCLHPAERGHELAYVTGERMHPRVTGQQVAAQVEVAAPPHAVLGPRWNVCLGRHSRAPPIHACKPPLFTASPGSCGWGLPRGGPGAAANGLRRRGQACSPLSPLPPPTALGPPTPGSSPHCRSGWAPTDPDSSNTVCTPVHSPETRPRAGLGAPPPRTPGPAERGRFTVQFGKSAQSPPCYRLPGFGWTRSI